MQKKLIFINKKYIHIIIYKYAVHQQEFFMLVRYYEFVNLYMNFKFAKCPVSVH